MPNNYTDLLHFSNDIPITIRVFNARSMASSLHRHSELELLFVVSGSATIFVNNKSYPLLSEDVFLVNENVTHEIISNDFTALSVLLRANDLNHPRVQDNYLYNLNSSGETMSEQYNYIRHLIAQLIKVNSSGENLYMTYSIVYAILDHINSSFQDIIPQNNSSTSKYSSRITEILNYIDDHYSECITLNDLADEVNLSVPYLSSFFKKNMQQTFSEYYNDLRLFHSVSNMLTSDENLETIALNCGFPDSRSFVSQFKRKHGTTPSAYRSSHKEGISSNIEPNNSSNNSDIVIASDLKSLAKYLDIYATSTPIQSTIKERKSLIDGGVVNFLDEGIKLSHTYRNFCCVGSARQLLYQDVRDMLSNIQSYMKYKYIKFHGILSDEMMVYSESDNGVPIYSFTLIDKVIDFLVEINLRPLIQLSFMPHALASDKEKLIDMRNYNTSPPKDMNKWKGLVHKLVEHLLERYGVDTVHSWLFCVWNEPDSSPQFFGWDDPYEFYDFYKQTYDTVKSISPNLLFGTPSMLLILDSKSTWVDDYIKYCFNNNCVADFFNIHFYDNNFVVDDEDAFTLKNLVRKVPLTEDIYNFTKHINNLKTHLKSVKLDHIPIYLTEWNLTVSHRDLINDTCFKSCYIIKNLLENYDRLDSFGYWCLTDFIEEMHFTDELYHGGLGMFTHNGIPKAHYNTFKMLPLLGSHMLKKGKGYFITRSECNKKISLIAYNYEQYSKLFASGILFDMSDENRYAPFIQKSKATFLIEINNIPSKKCLIKESYVNQSFGSSYDIWTLMGAPTLVKNDDITYLKQQSQPGMYIHRNEIPNKTLQLEIELAPLEVRLIEIELY